MTRLSPLNLNRHRVASSLPDVRNGWRAVCDERARKLRRRGETVEWRPQLDSMAWLPGGRRRIRLVECELRPLPAECHNIRLPDEIANDHPALSQMVMIMRCPGCGHLERSKTIESAGFDLDCPRCWLYNLSDFVPA